MNEKNNTYIQKIKNWANSSSECVVKNLEKIN